MAEWEAFFVVLPPFLFISSFLLIALSLVSFPVPGCSCVFFRVIIKELNCLVGDPELVVVVVVVVVVGRGFRCL